MNSMEAQTAIKARVAACIALARSLYPTYDQPDPVVKCDVRGSSKGGYALGYRELGFNLDWYAADPERYLNIVIPHEVAHIVDNAINPQTPRVTIRNGRMVRERQVSHGVKWVRICLALGGDGKRTCDLGNFAVKRRQTTQYLYQSSGGTMEWVGAVHHGRLQKKGRAGYALRTPRGHRITHDGYQGQRRTKA